MIRKYVSAAVLLLMTSVPSNASQCLDESSVQEMIMSNAIGVEQAYFSNLRGSPSEFIFKLKGEKVLLVSFEGNCVTAETMTYKQYVASMNEPADECDGCGEQPD